MEFNEDKKEYADDEYVDIYSKKAIFWFSVFSYMFGGVLLAINLWNAGYKRVVSMVLLFLLTFYFLTFYIIQYSGINITPEYLKSVSSNPNVTFTQILPLLKLIAITFGLNIIAAIVLTQYFFKKYFPDNDYYPKPVLQPLIIYIILAIVSRLLV